MNELRKLPLPGCDMAFDPVPFLILVAAKMWPQKTGQRVVKHGPYGPCSEQGARQNTPMVRNVKRVGGHKWHGWVYDALVK